MDQSPIPRDYNIIRNEDSDLDSEEHLQVEVKDINNSPGPDCLVLKLLVFGALLRLGLSSDTPTRCTFQRAIAQRRETTVVWKQVS